MDGLYRVFAQELVRKRRVTVPFPKKCDLVSPVMTEFQKFLEEPLKLKYSCSFRDKLGWHRRRDEEWKDFFHYSPRLLAIAQEGEWEPFIRLCEAAAVLFDHSHRLLLCFLQALDDVLPGCNFHMLASQEVSRNTSVLRLLEYEDRDPGTIIAYPHADKGFLSLSIHDSKPGLWLEEDDGDVAYVSTPEAALVFPAKQAMRICPPLKPLYHKVIAGERPPGEHEKRQAAVLFLDIDEKLLT